VELRELRQEDWPAVREIFEQGIAGRNATFETEAPSWEAWDRSQLDGHRWVAVEHGRVVGWVAAHPVSSRPCYAGVVEHSVYVDSGAQGKGIGRALLERLFESTEQAGIWTIQTGVFPENEASLALHRKTGFRVVGTQERLGKLDGVWRDVVVLERRSKEIS
jgi:L-amino acid N-acyltransferase YncA